MNKVFIKLNTKIIKLLAVIAFVIIIPSIVFGAESTFTTSLTTTGFVATPTPTPTPTTPSGGGGGTGGGGGSQIIITDLFVIAGTDKAMVTFKTNQPTATKLTWGLGGDYELGSLVNGEYTKDHSFTITGLNPATLYKFKVFASIASGAEVNKESQFTTLAQSENAGPLPNPTDFKAEAREKDILLSWVNPTDPRFNDVRIVRTEGFYPIDQFDGDPIYEGDEQSFVDTSAKPGVTYYYAIFARDREGNYSSGALAQARIALPGELATSTIADPFANIPEASNVDPRFKSLRLADFEFLQDGKLLASVENNTVAIHGDKNLTIRLKSDKVPPILKTIAFTLKDPDDKNKVFPFLLRINKDKTYYEATIGALGKSGRYGMSVAILDYENNGLVRLNGTLAALSFMPFLDLNNAFDFFGLLILFLLILLIILAILAIRRWMNRNDDEEYRSDKQSFWKFGKKQIVASAIVLVSLFGFNSASAAFNNEINYQGKLSNSLNAIVTDGNYNIRFKLYTTQTGGAPIWTETLCNTSDCAGTGAGTDNRVSITNGLFSVMLGSTSPLTSVDFNQTLYLGVEIGGSGAVASWDGEMSPRKVLGAVPAAFIAENANALSGLNSTQFLRSDAQNATSSSSTFLNIVQSGAGKVAEFFGTASQSVLALLSNGNVGIGTTTPYAKLSVAGEVVSEKITATSTSATSTLPNLSITNLKLGSDFVKDITGNGLSVTNGSLNVTGLTSTGNANMVASYDSSGNLVATSTPSFARVIATSSLETSEFAGGLTAAQDAGGLTVLTTGNVGIGESSPSQKLTVRGQSFFDGVVGIGTEDVPQGQLRVAGLTQGLMYISQLGADADEKNWYFDAEGGDLYWGVNNDTFGSGSNYARISRTGTTIDSFEVMYGAQNQAWFKQDVAGIQPYNVTPTAHWHIRQGSSLAGNAPLKIDAGPLLNTPEAGAVEYQNDKWYLTIDTGPARKEFALNDKGLSQDRIPFVTTNGRFTDDANFVYSSGNLGIGTTTPSQALSVGGNILGNKIIGSYFVATSTTASVLPYASTTAITVSGTNGLQLATSLNGPLQANNGLVSATTSIGVVYGGTGATTFGQGWIYTDGGTGALNSSTSPTVNYITATSTTATSSFAGGVAITKGLNIGSGYIYGAGLQACANSADKLTYDATTGKFGCGTDAGAGGGITSLAAQYSPLQTGAGQTLATSSDTNIALTITSNSNTHTFTPSWIGTLAVGRGGTGLSSAPTYGQILLGNASNGYTLSATSSLGIALSDTTGILAINRGGTGTSSFPTYGKILVGNASNGYDLLSTSSLNIQANLANVTGTLGVANGGTGATSFGQGWIYTDGGTGALNSSTSPTVNYITATSTTATSTFNGGLVAGGSGSFRVLQNGNIGIGTTSPASKLELGTGQFYIPNGLRTAPAIAFSNDTNTGIYLEGADQLGFAAGGNLQFYAASNGIAMGTGKDFNMSATSYLIWSDTNLYRGGANQLKTDDDFASVSTGSSYFMGSLGVGTSSPYAKLSVAGQAVAEYFTATSTTIASTFPYASTTAITVSGTNGLQLATGLNGPLQANNGLVSATTSIGVIYGGTGLTSAPTYGQLLLGNASNGYTLSATSSLGIALSDTTGTLAVNRGGTGLSSTPTYGQILVGNASSGYDLLSTSSLNIQANLANITGTLGVANGGTGATTFGQGWIYTDGGTGALNSSTSPTVNYITATSTTATSSFAWGLTMASSTVNVVGSSGRVGIGTANPLGGLDVSNGTVALYLGADGNSFNRTNNTQKIARVISSQYSNSAAGATVFIANNTSSSNDLFIGGGSTSYNAVTGISFYTGANTGTAQGSIRMSINSSGNVGIGTTSPYSKLSVWGSGTGSSRLFELTNNSSTTLLSVLENGTAYFLGNLGIGTTTPGQALSVGGDILGNNIIGSYFTATSTTVASTFPYASTTALTVSGTNGLKVGTLNGPLQANNGVVSATTSVGVLYGGTGLSSAPTYGQLLLGNASNGYTLSATSTLGIALSDTTGTLAVNRGGTGLSSTPTYGQILVGNSSSGYDLLSTSSLNIQANLANITGTLGVANGGTGATTFGQGWIYTDGGTGALNSSTSPTVNYITATSTTATSTFNGGLSVVGSTGLNVLQNGFVGIGKANPATKLDVVGDIAASGYVSVADNSDFGFGDRTTRIAGNAGSDFINFVVNNNSSMYLNSANNVGIGTTSPYAKLSVVGETVSNYFTATSTTASSTLPNIVATNLRLSGSLYDSTNSAGVNGYVLQSNGSTVQWVSTSSLNIAGGSGVTGGTAGMLTAWTGASTLTATGTPTAASYFATSTTATSTFLGGLSVAGSNGLTIMQNGYVGIGSSTPYAKLGVVADSSMFWSSTTPNSSIFSVASSSRESALYGYATSTPNEYFRITAGGDAFLTGKVLNPTFLAETQGSTPGTTLDGAVSVFVSGKYAYVANNNRDSLAVIDISNPNSPTFIAETRGPTPGTSLDGATSVFVSGKYAYVANSNRSSLAIIDISNPSVPTFVGETRGPNPGTSLNGANSVYVSGKYAYVANYTNDTLAVIDISNPTSPTFVAETQGPTPGTSLDSASSVFVSGKYAYVTTYVHGSLAVIDISNPASPTFIAETQGPAAGMLLGATSVYVSGKYAYVANGSRRSLAVIDISNPSSPTFVAENRGPVPGTSLDSISSVFVSGKYAYVAISSRDSVAVLDISNPAVPIFIAETKGPVPGTSLDSASSIFVSGKYAYVANINRDSLAVIDVGGAEVSNLYAGDLETDNLQVNAFAQLNQGLLVRGGINADGGLFSQGQGVFTVASSTNFSTLNASTSLPFAVLSANVVDTNSSSITDALSLSHGAWASSANNIGVGIGFALEAEDGYATSTGRIASIMTGTTLAAPTSALTFSIKNSNAGLTEALRIDSTGNVGVGTSSPWAKLSINPNGITGPAFAIGSSTATRFVVTNGGLVGIGTTSPASRLNIEGPGLESALILTDSDYSAGYSSISSNIFLQSDNGVLSAGTTNKALTATTSLMKINSDGNVRNIALGIGAMANNINNGSDNTAIGYNVLSSNTVGLRNTGIGYSTLGQNTSGQGNIGIGGWAVVVGTLGNNTTGSNNLALGVASMAANTIGSDNISLGKLALGSNQVSSYNIALGTSALYANTATGSIAIGYQAGDALTTGSYNVILGYDVDAPSDTDDNQLNIGNLIFGTSVDGRNKTISSGNIGIGTTSPYAKLSVAGQVVGQYFTATSTTASSTLPNVIATNLRLNGILYDTNNASGTNGYVLQTTGSGVQWVSTSSLNITAVASGGANFGKTFELGTDAFGVSALSPTTTVPLYITSSATSSFLGGIESWSKISAPYFHATSTTATSTFAGGLSVGGASGLYSFTNGRTSLASTSPWAQLSINSDGITGPAFAIGSSTATNFIVTNAGNVGVGTTSPAKKFAVSGPIYAIGDTTAGLYLGDPGDANSRPRIVQNGPANIALYNTFRDNNTAKFSWGYGGAGTAPASSFFISRTSDFTSPDFLLTPTGVTALGLLGNVGIATSSPNNKLDIYSTTKAAIGFSGASGSDYKWTIGMNVTNGGRFSIASSTALGTLDRFVINGAGNVGIGTTSPFATLSVAGIGTFDNYVRASYFTATSTSASTFPYASTTALTVAGTNGLQLASGLNGPLQAINGLVSSTSTLSVAYGGTGLSSIPTYGKLLVGNASGGYDLTSTSSLGILASSAIDAGTTGQLPYYASNGQAITATSSLFLSTAGYLGIGTTTPTSALSVFSTAVPQLQLAYDKDNYLAGSVSSSGGITLAINGSAGGLTVTNPQPTAVVSGTGTAAPYGINLSGGIGGNSLDTNIGVGGVGGGIQFAGGAGGTATASTFSETGGAGGVISITGGAGGAASSASVDFMTRQAGNGGQITLTSGAGGNASNGGIGSLNTAGNGGAFVLKAGAGGDASGATTNNGGNGGSLYVTGGAGGTGASQNGTAGNVFLGYDSLNSIGNVYFGNQSSSFIGSTGNFGVGTSSPYAKLSVAGQVVGQYFTATSTTASSTLPNVIATNLRLNGILYDTNNASGTNGYVLQTTGSGVQWVSTSSLNIAGGNATLSGGTDGMLTAWSGASTVTATGTPTAASYFATSSTATSTFLGGLSVGGASGLYSFTNGRTSLASTSPWAQLSINPDGITGPAFAIGSSTATNFVVTNGGNVGIGTTSPFANLSIQGNSAGLNALFSVATSSRLSTLNGFSSASTTPNEYFRIGYSGDTTITGKVINPTIAGGVKDNTLLSGAFNVYVAGKFAYVVNNTDNSLRIINVASTTNPFIVGGIKNSSLLNGAYAVVVSGDYAYVANNTDDSLRVIDISNPSSPIIVGGIKDSTNLDGARSVYVSGKYAYVGTYSDNSLRIIDISNPVAPVMVGGVKDNTNLGSVNKVFVSGKYAYTSNVIDNSLRIIDISNPNKPYIVGGVKDNALLDGINSVFVVGRYAYVTDYGERAFRVIDVSNPASPFIIGSVRDSTLFNNTQNVFVAGKYAYVSSNGNSSLTIIDISNPVVPTIVGSIKDTSLLGGLYNVFVQGRYAYVANYTDNSLRIIDVGGAEISTMFAGSIETDNLTVNAIGLFNQGLTVRGGLSSDLLNVNGAGSFTLATSTTGLSYYANPINALTATILDNNTAGITSVAMIAHGGISSTTVGSNGIGSGLGFANIDSSGISTTTGMIASIFTNVNPATPTSALAFSIKNTVGSTSEVARIDSTGNFGIGTTSPYARLSVAGETVSNYFTATSTTASSTLPNVIATNLRLNGILYDTNNASGTNGYVLQTTGNGVQWVSTSSLNIAGGNATLSGGTDGMLTAWSGASTVTATGTPTAGSYFATSTTATSTFLGGLVAGTNGLTVLQNGKIGIGTITPASELSVNGGLALGTYAASTNAGTGNLVMSGVLGVGLTDTLSNKFAVSGTSYFTGNVGLGTSTPYAQLSLTNNSVSQTAFALYGFNSQTSPLFLVASTTGTATSTAFLIDGNGKVGIGTTSPYAQLSVQGLIAGQYFNADATTSTSTLAGGLNVGSGNLVYDFTTGITSVNALETGNLNFDTDAGAVSWVDLPISSATVGTVESYAAQIAGTPVLTVYGLANGSGGVATTTVAIGTSSPYTNGLTVWGRDTIATTRSLDVVNNASTSLLTVFNGGIVKIGGSTSTTTINGYLDVLGTGSNSTSTFSSNLWVKGSIQQSGSATSTFANGIQLTSGCFMMPSGSCLANGVASISGGQAGKMAFWTAADTLSNNTYFAWDNTNMMLGVGTSTPAAILSVTNNAGTSANTPLFMIASTTAGNSTSTLMVVTASGNVGIGTTSPLGKLAVDAGVTSVNTAINASGSINDFLQFDIKNTSSGTGAQAGYSATADNGTLTTNFAWMGINNSNFYNPQAYNVGGALDVSFVGSGNDMYVANVVANKKMHFMTGSSATTTNIRMTIDGNGKVGIGSTSPNYALDVNGDVNVATGKCFRVDGVCIGYVVKLVSVFASSSPGNNSSIVATGAVNSSPSFSGTTLTLPSNTSYYVAELWGGGGGGGASSTAATDATSGGNSCFGPNATACTSPYATAGGGGPGLDVAAGDRGAGGTATVISTDQIGINGYPGHSGSATAEGGMGGSAPRGGTGGFATTTTTRKGFNGNSPGGGGAGGRGSATVNGGGGGGGAYVQVVSTSTATRYFTIGVGGTGANIAGVCTETTSGCGGNGANGGMVISVYATSSPNAAGTDYAEMFPVSNSLIGPGDIVSVDAGLPVSMKYAEQGDKALAGVVATKPGQILGDEKAIDQRPIALSGRVPVKVNLEGGVIRPGDRIAISSVRGVGKKAGPLEASVGIALDSFDGEEQGTVMMFVNIQQNISVKDIGEELLKAPTDADSYDFVGNLMKVIQTRYATSTILGIASTTSTSTVDSSMMVNQNQDLSTLDTSVTATSSIATTSTATSSNTQALAEAIVALDLKVDAFIASSTLSYDQVIASTTSALASSTPFINALASSTASVLTNDQTFIQSLTNSMKNALASATDWVVEKFTAKVAYINRIEAETVAVSKGMEIVDQTTGAVWCVTIKNGDWNKVQGACASIASTTQLQVTPTPSPLITLTITPSITPIITPTSTSTETSSSTDTIASSTDTSGSQNTSTSTDSTSSTSSVGGSSTSPSPSPSITVEATPTPASSPETSPSPSNSPVSSTDSTTSSTGSNTDSNSSTSSSNGSTSTATDSGSNTSSSGSSTGGDTGSVPSSGSSDSASI